MLNLSSKIKIQKYWKKGTSCYNDKLQINLIFDNCLASYEPSCSHTFYFLLSDLRYNWQRALRNYFVFIDSLECPLHIKMKFSIQDFFSKYDQIRRNLRNLQIWSQLLKKSLMENFIFRPAIFISLDSEFLLSPSLNFQKRFFFSKEIFSRLSGFKLRQYFAL